MLTITKKDSRNYSEINNFQHLLKSVSSCLFNKVPKHTKPQKQIRRKERLKEMFLNYCSSLDVSPDPTFRVTSTKLPPEAHLKNLINHQQNQIKSITKQLSKRSKNNKNPFPEKSFPNKIFALLNHPTYSFLPKKNNSSIFSLFNHESEISLKFLQKNRKKVESKLKNLEKLENFIKMKEDNKTWFKRNRQVALKILQEVERIYSVKKSSGHFSSRYKSADISDCRESIRNTASVEETSLTARSASVSARRLGLFISKF